MKKLCFIFLLTTWSAVLWAQQVQDSTKVESLEEVVLSVTRAKDKTPMTFSTITKEDIETINLGQDLPILMDQMPSVVTTSDAGAGIGYTGIRVRGSDATRVNITINGIPYNDPESHGTYWVNMPDFASSVEDIQLQRGVGTSTNGAGAFGASINIETTNPTSEPIVETSHSLGSFNTLKHNVKLNSGLINNFYASARLSRITSDGYIDRSSSNLKSFFTEVGYINDGIAIKGLVFGGQEITNQAWYGTPEAVINSDMDGILEFIDHEGYSFSQDQLDNLLSNPGRTYNHYVYDNEVDNYKQTHHQIHIDKKIDEYWSLKLSGNYTKGIGYFEQYKHDEKVEDYFPNRSDASDEGAVIRRRWLDNDSYSFVYGLNYNKRNLDFVFGGAYSSYIGDHFGELIWDSFPAEFPIRTNYYDSVGKKKDFNSYAKAEYNVSDKLLVFADLQYRRIDYKTDGISSDLVEFNVDENYNFFNPKFGVSYNLNSKGMLYGSFAVANREPNRDDLVRNPIKPKSEQLRDLELGYKFNSQRFYANSNLFYMDYKNQLVLTGAIDDVGDAIRQNVDKSYRLGIEFEAGFKFNDFIRLDANATVSQNKIKDFDYVVYDTQYDPNTWEDSTTAEVTSYNDTDISFSPNLIMGSMLTVTPVDKLSVSLLSKYVGKQYLDNTQSDSKSMDAYFVNNFNVSYTLNPSWIKEIKINLLVNNVLNEKYVSNGYTYSYYYREQGSNTPMVTEKFYFPQATTNFLLGTTIKF